MAHESIVVHDVLFEIGSSCQVSAIANITGTCDLNTIMYWVNKVAYICTGLTRWPISVLA